MNVVSLRETIQHFYFEKLDWCGCGKPWDAMLEIAKFLEGRQKKEPFPEDPLSMCLAYELDRAGFTEHGSNIYYCWLTEEGEQFLGLIREAEKMGILNTALHWEAKED
jgi:hypothetical protein